MNKPITTPAKGIYMHLADGSVYHPFHPEISNLTIETVAHHLACQGRWNGATQHPTDSDRIFLSVAEHSVNVSLVLEEDLKRPDLAMAGLLHEVAEAILGDMIRPLKYSPAFHIPFKDIEENIERVEAKRFGISWPFDPLVKQADEIVCHTEWLQVVPRTAQLSQRASFHDGSRKMDREIIMMPPKIAMNYFMGRYWTLLAKQNEAA